jgi:multidrug efflux pump subunit AcrA (membrane-fusion protein)
MSGTVSGVHFSYIDQLLEPAGSGITSMYSLGSHAVLKKQILEEMKYRAPMIFSLELTDKFKKTGLASNLGQASQFSKNAFKIEALIDERDDNLDRAWIHWTSIHQKAAAIHPFYQTQLSDLNQLSNKIGIHTAVEVKQSLNNAKRDIKELGDQVKKIDGQIGDLIEAGNASASAIRRLRDTKTAIRTQISDLNDKISDLEQLLQDIIKYTELLVILKFKSTADLAELKSKLNLFDEALSKAQAANDQLNAELRTMDTQVASSTPYKANEAFQSIHVIQKQALDEYGSRAASAVATFSGLQSQLGSVWLFDADNYRNATDTLELFWENANSLFVDQGAKEKMRNKNKSEVVNSKRDLRRKAQPYLDQVTRAMGTCSFVSSTDPFKELYVTLQGEPSKGSAGYYQAYMTANQQTNITQPVPDIHLDNADKAGASAMNLVFSMENLLNDVRDEFYVDEFAVSKFSYRTLGLEKDITGQVKQSKEMSRPESHALANQELEYLIYGANSCIGNYAAAYAEMFAIRLAVGTAEALTEPHIQAMNAGSPLLVFLAAVAEGAVKAQLDMMKLVEGEAVPLSKKLGSVFNLAYKDYLRIFLLLHSRDKVMLSRMQALIELNTGISLEKSTTYLSGRATSSVKLWFLPGMMKILGASDLYSCEMTGNRCHFTKTGVMAY